MRTRIVASATLVLAASAFGATKEHWSAHNGEDAPRLIAAGWSGTPVSLDEVRGNAVVLAFWNADVPC